MALVSISEEQVEVKEEAKTWMRQSMVSRDLCMVKGARWRWHRVEVLFKWWRPVAQDVTFRGDTSAQALIVWLLVATTSTLASVDDGGYGAPGGTVRQRSNGGTNGE